MRRHHVQGARALARERGAVLVEMALIVSLLITLVLGVFEIGMAWSDHQAVTQASRSGARVGSQLGTAAQSDNQILRAVQAGLQDQASTVTRIVVYEADANGEMPAACKTASAPYSGAAHCNVYDAATFAELGTASKWGSGSACGTLDDNWCSATDRDNAQDSATYLGVYVEVERQYLTGLFGGGTHRMSEHTVMRVEPAQ
jgi:Flp pilus assembly protein TadG